jgi:hypothetical protein
MIASSASGHAKPTVRSAVFASALALAATMIVGSAGAPSARAAVILTVDHVFDTVFEGQTIDFKFTLANNTAAAINNIAPAFALPLPVLPDPTDNVTSVTFAGLPAMLAAGASVTFTETIHTDNADGDFVGDTGANPISTSVSYNNPTQTTNVVSTLVIVIDFTTPEIAPGPMAGAVALLVGGVLSLTDRRRRR